MAREALGVVGAAVGFVVGGPTGAQIGFALGSAVGAYVDPVKIPSPGLSEAPIQTSRDGIPIPLIWGLQAVAGNILQKNPEVIVTTTERQGKGGGTKVETQQRFRTFAIGVCRGPQSEITRIWENNKLVYDARAVPAISAEETAEYAAGITIYMGDESQLPDPELEAYWTTAETPAYRSLVYVVWNDKDLTDTGGAIPQFFFEINGSRDLTVTSRPYPLEVYDAIDPIIGFDEALVWKPPIEGVDPTLAFIDITLRMLYESTTVPPEGVDPTLDFAEILLRTLQKTYSVPAEGTDPTLTFIDITLRVALVQYTDDPEGIDPTVSIQDITLT